MTEGMAVALCASAFGLAIVIVVALVSDARAGDETRWWHNKDHKWW